MTALAELVARDDIALDREASDWEDAIRVAGRVLEESGATTADYTQAMVDSVHRNGPYIVLAPGFAFPHARPSEAVRRTAMSWVRLRTPVEFGSRANDPVSLVVALAATDSSTHQDAMAALAVILADPAQRAALDEAGSPEEVHALLTGDDGDPAPGPSTPGPSTPETSTPETSEPEPGAAGPAADRGASETHDRILTVCGNGLGTSLFLKNTLEQVLDRWGWGRLVTVEATDTVSARGKADGADLVLTSGEIARTLGDVGVPVLVIQDFTSQREIDAALREAYDLATTEKE